jgi:hypothetical protein
LAADTGGATGSTGEVTGAGLFKTVAATGGTVLGASCLTGSGLAAFGIVGSAVLAGEAGSIMRTNTVNGSDGGGMTR